MKNLSAKEAFKITTDSDAYLESLLQEIFSEVKKQASQGLRWAHVNIHRSSEQSFVSRVKDILITEGYKVDNPNTTYQFKIEW